MIRSRAGFNQTITPPGQVTLSDYIKDIERKEMISEVDLRDWIHVDTAQAFDAVENSDSDDPRYKTYLYDLVHQIELFQAKQIKQVAALLRKGD